MIKLTNEQYGLLHTWGKLGFYLKDVLQIVYDSGYSTEIVNMFSAQYKAYGYARINCSKCKVLAKYDCDHI